MIIFCIPCLMLVMYFLIASIFFPKYRGYLKEAWNCFSDKIRGKQCSFSFDNKMRLAFSMWLTKKGMVGLGRFFNDPKKFTITFTIIGILFSIVSTVLFIVLIKFLFFGSPCADGTCSLL